MTELIPSKKQLRIFGLIMVAVAAMLVGFVLPKFAEWQASYFVWLGVLIFALVAVLMPLCLTPLYRAWIALGDVLARINTFMTLLLVWLVLFIPIGVIMKVCRYDPLKRSFDRELKSYRVERPMALDKSSLERPF